MDDTGLREFLYFFKLPADELSDHICSLPYTLVELIIETALNDEDFMMGMLTETVDTLKKNTHLCNVKRALRKLVTVCRALDANNHFDFGDLELINGGGNISGDNEPIKIIKNLIDIGQLEMTPINGRYKPFKSMRKFIRWCVENGYSDDISPNFILNNIFFRGYSKRSIQEYINEAKREQ